MGVRAKSKILPKITDFIKLKKSFDNFGWPNNIVNNFTLVELMKKKKNIFRSYEYSLSSWDSDPEHIAGGFRLTKRNSRIELE